MRQHTSLIICTLILISGALIGCSKPQPAQPAQPQGKRYEVKGKVVSVDKERHRVKLDHEDIVGYMDAMIMSFPLNDEAMLGELAPGDQLHATLVVGDTSAELTEVTFSRTTVDPSAKSSPELQPEPKAGDAVPAFSLINQDAKPIRFPAQYKGKALLLSFIYTHCPDAEYCTLMSTNFAEIDKALAQDRDLYQKTHLLSVSFDPERDTPQVLRSYGAAHTGNYTGETFAHWEFATGSKDEIKKLAQFFGLTYQADSDRIAHSMRTVVITPDGKVFKIYRDNQWKPDDLLKDVRDIFDQSQK